MLTADVVQIADDSPNLLLQFEKLKFFRVGELIAVHVLPMLIHQAVCSLFRVVNFPF
jgi:hypothetical protein